MKIAILYEDDSIFVQFNTVEFSELLKKHLNNGLTVDEAFKKIIADLKKKTLRA